MPKSSSTTNPELVDHQVRRADIAMHEAQRVAGSVSPLVGIMQTVERLLADFTDELGSERPAIFREDRIECGADDQRHGDEIGVVDSTQIINGHDVGMLEQRRDARLLQKELDEAWIPTEVRQDALDDQQALESPSALARQEHLGHAATSDGRKQLEFSKRGGQRVRIIIPRRLRRNEPPAMAF
jgi:hypothetical protein